MRYMFNEGACYRDVRSRNAAPVAHPLGAPGTRSPGSLGPVPVFEVTVRGLLLVADSPAALTGALASALRARPAARAGAPYRTLGEVTSGRAEALVYGLEMVESSRACRRRIAPRVDHSPRESAPPSRE